MWTMITCVLQDVWQSAVINVWWSAVITNKTHTWWLLKLCACKSVTTTVFKISVDTAVSCEQEPTKQQHNIISPACTRPGSTLAMSVHRLPCHGITHLDHIHQPHFDRPIHTQWVIWTLCQQPSLPRHIFPGTHFRPISTWETRWTLFFFNSPLPFLMESWSHN